MNDPFVKVLLPLAAIFLVYLLNRYKYHYSWSTDLQLRRPPLPAFVFWVMVAVAWMLVTDYFLDWRGPWDFSPWQQHPLYVSILRVLAVCFLGPIAEELIFRGLFFFRVCSRLKMNPWIACILLAAVWAAIHYRYEWRVIAVIFVEGIFLGAALIKSRSLATPMVMHICWNLYAIW